MPLVRVPPGGKPNARASRRWHRPVICLGHDHSSPPAATAGAPPGTGAVRAAAHIFNRDSGRRNANDAPGPIVPALVRRVAATRPLSDGRPGRSRTMNGAAQRQASSGALPRRRALAAGLSALALARAPRLAHAAPPIGCATPPCPFEPGPAGPGRAPGSWTSRSQARAVLAASGGRIPRRGLRPQPRHRRPLAGAGQPMRGDPGAHAVVLRPSAPARPGRRPTPPGPSAAPPS